MATPRSRVSRVLVTGPVAPFADAYRAELLARGYTPLSAVNELRQVKRFSRWLDAGGLAVAELSEAGVEEFLAFQRASGVDCRHSLSRPGLMCLLDVLRALGVLAAETPAVADSSTDLLLVGFQRYLLTERGLAAGTVVLYLAAARRFVDGLWPDRGLAAWCCGPPICSLQRGF